MRFKEKDMCNKMSSVAKCCKSNERGMRDCDECWKGRSEVQSTWEKKYILEYKPYNSIYTSIMKFRYLEDYKKMKKINEILAKIVRKMDNTKHGFANYNKKEKFIYDLKYETEVLENLVKKCYFFNVDYDDGKVFTYEFWSINTFLANGKRIKFIFGRLLRALKPYYDDGYDDLYYILKKEICPALKRIYNELLRRGIFDLD